MTDKSMQPAPNQGLPESPPGGIPMDPATEQQLLQDINGGLNQQNIQPSGSRPQTASQLAE